MSLGSALRYRASGSPPEGERSTRCAASARPRAGRGPPLRGFMPRSVSEVTQAECPVNGPPAARGVRCSGRPGRCSAWRPRRSRWRRNGPCLSRRGVQDSVRRTRPAAATRPHTGAITPDQRRHRKVVLHLEVRVPIPRRDHRRDALDTEIHRFRIIYNTIRPHQALGDRTPSTAYTGCDQQKTAR
jgi:hypothetical protein